jgi:hypothetical protein
VAAQSIEDLQRTIDLVLHGIIRSLCPFGEFVRPLQVHRQLVLDGPDSPLPRSAESLSRHFAYPGNGKLQKPRQSQSGLRRQPWLSDFPSNSRKSGTADPECTAAAPRR